MNILFILFAIFINLLGSSAVNPVFAASATVEISGTVPGCGDGVIQSGEECDGSDLGSQSCSSKGFSGGTLSCNANCTFNTFQCTSTSSGSGGGGGGDGIYIPSILKPKPKPVLPTGDFNGDGFTNFRDLSIVLFWFNKTGEQIVPYDLNGDGNINFKDVSILFYRWKE